MRFIHGITFLSAMFGGGAMIVWLESPWGWAVGIPLIYAAIISFENTTCRSN